MHVGRNYVVKEENAQEKDRVRASALTGKKKEGHSSCKRGIITENDGSKQ